MKIQTSILLLTSLFSSAIAQEKGGGHPKNKGRRPEQVRAAEFFKQLDSNSDGKVTREEFAQCKRAAELPDEARTKIFDRLDKNNDGFITDWELQPTQNDRHGRSLSKADKNKDGRVSREEFLANPPFAQADLERLNKIFDRIDRNSDGFLDGKDRVPGARQKPPGEKRPSRMDFEKLDLNEDGFISRDEFKKSPTPRPGPEEERLKQFDRMDDDGDGRLSAEEVKKHLQKRLQRKSRRPEPKK